MNAESITILKGKNLKLLVINGKGEDKRKIYTEICLKEMPGREIGIL